MIQLLVCAAVFSAGDKTPAAEQPYRVLVWIDVPQRPQFPPSLERTVRQDIRAHARRYLGTAWDLTLSDAPAGLPTKRLPKREELADHVDNLDKLLWVKFRLPDVQQRRVTLWAVEYDVVLDAWGPPAETTIDLDDRLGVETFVLLQRRFRPRATVEGRGTAGNVRLVVKGLALQPVDSTMPLVPPNLPFRVFREHLKNNERVLLEEVKWTFVLYRKPDLERLGADADLVSAFRSALSRRTRGRSRLHALGCSLSKDAETTIRFVTGEEKAAVVGLEVGLRPQDSGVIVPLGTTDYRGRIRLRPVKLASEIRAPDHARMFELRLKTGDAVLASFPVVPGVTADATVQVTVDSLLTEVTGRITSLQDLVLDAVVARRILEKRVDLLAQRNDVEGAKSAVAKLNAQPGRKELMDRLTQIKQFAQARAQEMDRPGPGSVISHIFEQTEQFINRYSADLAERQITIETVNEPANAS